MSIYTLHYSPHYSSHGSHSMRNGFVGKGERSRPIYLKICRCYLIVFLNWTPIYNWSMVQWESKDKHHKKHMLKRDQTTSSNSINSSTLNWEHTWEDPCNQHKSQQTCTSDHHNELKERPILNPIFFADASYIVDSLTQHTCFVM